MRISVIITHYRNVAYLKEALSSVLAQTRAADEIIVIDDATPEEEAAGLQALSEGVRLFRLPRNVGPGAARQAGVEIATGDWLAYLDADDLWEPNKLERQERFILEHPDVVAVHAGITVFSEKGAPERVYVDKVRKHEGPDSLIWGEGLPSSLMHRRDAVCRIGGWSPDRNLIDDWDMDIRMTNHAGPLWFVAEPLTRMRRSNHGNLSSKLWSNVWKQCHTAWRHRALATQHFGPGMWRSSIGRLMIGESRKTGGVAGLVVGTLGRLVRLGAPPLPPRRTG